MQEGRYRGYRQSAAADEGARWTRQTTSMWRAQTAATQSSTARGDGLQMGEEWEL